MEFVNEIGFLPLLGMGIKGWSAEEQVYEECGYAKLPDGGWEWPLWEWKGSVIQESGCAYGKFFQGKAGFVSKAWWPDFCNWRRSRYPRPSEDSIEAMILATLKEHGSLITRELRAACGFTGTKMRSRFDNYITVWRWVVASLRKISSIRTTGTASGTDGDGRRSPHPKPCSVARLAVRIILPRNPIPA